MVSQENNNNEVKQTIPGCVAIELFEQAREGDFNSNEEYNADQIYDKCEGVLFNVENRYNNYMKLEIMKYDHHNEPRETVVLVRENGEWILDEVIQDWSKTKYGPAEKIQSYKRFVE